MNISSMICLETGDIDEAVRDAESLVKKEARTKRDVSVIAKMRSIRDDARALMTKMHK